MDAELTISAAILTGCGVIAEVVRRWLRSSSAAKLAAARDSEGAKIEVARTIEKISDGVRSDHARLIDTLVSAARADAQAAAAVDALRTAVAELTERMDRYDEFRKQAVYRPRPRRQ